MNKGISLWEKAKTVIPGGNCLLSKRPERYLPDMWPTYYSRAKGIEVWDLEGNKFIDMAQMGIGTAILGYSNDFVDGAVKSAIDQGVNTTLNCPEEVYLAEKLLSIDTFAGGVKFARTGGEAMSIAVRLARAYTGKDDVAFSGYHGWSDWYLASNLSSTESLNDHLLPGLDPAGVPKNLKGTAIPFKYNDCKDLKKQIKDKEIAAIVIEGARYDLANQDFLVEIKRACEEKKCLLIIDEISSGWRACLGGIYHTYEDITPDIVVYGKAMGNGYPISAIVGKKVVMESAQDTFISSTFWTERIGFVAALATISQLEEKNIPDQITQIGKYIGDMWRKVFSEFGIDAKVTEYAPLITFKLNYKNNAEILTYISQEMLKKGYLSASSIYVSASHTKDAIDEYTKSFRDVISSLSALLKTSTLSASLETRVREEGFARLT
jgi:glutamate-1-semialdehyde aminotransferase